MDANLASNIGYAGQQTGPGMDVPILQQIVGILGTSAGHLESVGGSLDDFRSRVMGEGSPKSTGNVERAAPAAVEPTAAMLLKLAKRIQDVALSLEHQVSSLQRLG
jgi:hypothetical protein